MDDLVSAKRVVCVFDPAIDLDATAINVYRESREEGLVTLTPGKHARWATVRPLSVGDFTACDSMPSAPVKLIRAFQLACIEVENFAGPDLSLKPEKPHRLPDGRERMIWSDEGMQRVADALGIAFIYEVGTVAFERAVQGNALGGSAFFTLPPSSEIALHRIERLRAARLAASDGTRSNETSARS